MSNFALPQKWWDTQAYLHSCPMCHGYLRNRGGAMTCDNCGFEDERLKNPLEADDNGVESFPPEWLQNPDLYYESKWKLSAGEGIPANYTPADPFDLHGKKPLIDAMEVPWWDYPPEQAKQIIVNAFRATMLSPRMNLKSNAILYQSLMDIPAEESDPDIFEQRIRILKSKWDQQGQLEIGQDPSETLDPNETLPGRFMPGFWGNIRRLANLGPFADEIYDAALEDIMHGGTGTIFRDKILKLNIPGVGAKVASFAWLALAPNTSELATLDVHMMRHLDQAGDSPANLNHYQTLENQLRNERDELYGTEVPLSHYQWAVWDARRTPGYHQDHTPLRAHQPTPFTQVQWPATSRPPRQVTPTVPENQMSLLGKWRRIPSWDLIRLSADSYTIQGKIIAGVDIPAEGIAVRPDRQSRAEIDAILGDLASHGEDIQRQKELAPEWAINRGAKVADSPSPTAQLPFGLGPGAGFTYAPGVIAVTEWADPRDNWLFEHPSCYGIVAEKGGATSHAVVVARTRNIAVTVDVPEATRINPGDKLQIDSGRAIIKVNGGGGDTELGEAQMAEMAIIRFVWSKGAGMTAPIPQQDPEGGTLHSHMIMDLFRQGKWDKNDSALGVIYEDGRVQMLGTPSDRDAMLEWLNQIHPITNVEENFSL